MKLENYIVVLLIFVALLTATFSVQGDFGDVYDVSISGEESVSTLTAFDEMNRISNNIQDKILGLSQKVTSFDPTAIYDVTGLFLDVGAYILQIPNAMSQSLELTMGMLNIAIPTWFSQLLLTLTGVLVAFAALKIFLKRGEI